MPQSFSPDDDSPWLEYAAGGGAAVTAILATFPVNKVMFRQQVHAIGARAAAKQIKHEGVGHLYRGVFSPLLMKFLSQSVMFGTYSQYSRFLRERLDFSLWSSHAVAAVGAGVTEAIFMPLERVQMLMQDAKYHTRFRNTVDALYQLRVFGPGEYYRGLSAVLLRNCPGNVVFFTYREKIKESLPESWRSRRSAANTSDFFSGAFLGALISTAYYPINVVKAHMQLEVGGPYLKFSTVFSKLVAERGLKGMFTGVHLNYTRSFLSWGIINVTYENLLRLLRPVL